MSPLTRAYWFGTVDARLVAIFRIGLGLILFVDCLDLFGSREPFYATTGLFPAFGPMEHRWSLFQIARSPEAVTAWFALGALSLLAFTVGLFTRVSTVLAWIFLVSLRTQNPWIATGGDYVAQTLVVFSLFTDMGATWSLDAVRRKASRSTAPALGWRLMLVHVAILYFVTARLKVRHGWLTEGDGVFQALVIGGFARPPGAWLAEHPDLCKLLTFGTLVFEFGFPLLAFLPWKTLSARLVAIAFNLALQVGILFTMKVGLFTPLMIWISLLLIPDAWVARVKFQPPAVVDPGPPARQPMLAGVAALGVVLMCWDAFVGSRIPMPGPVRVVQQWSAMEQPFELFGKGLGVSNWSGTGTRADGSTYDVVRELTPGLVSEPSWRFSVWFKLVFNEHHMDWPGVGAWMCRQDPALVSLEVVKDHYAPKVGVPPAFQHTVMLAHRCAR